MSRFDLAGEFQIGEERFSWIVKHYAGMKDAASNYRGVTARVTLVEGGFRELVVEFHPDDYAGQRPSSGRHFEARLADCTQQAIDAGWRPASRGKPFRLVAPKMGQRG